MQRDLGLEVKEVIRAGKIHMSLISRWGEWKQEGGWDGSATGERRREVGPGQNLRVPTTLTGGGDDEELTKVFDTLRREQEKQRRRGIIETKTEWVPTLGIKTDHSFPFCIIQAAGSLGIIPSPPCAGMTSVWALSLLSDCPVVAYLYNSLRTQVWSLHLGLKLCAGFPQLRTGHPLCSGPGPPCQDFP